MLVAILLLLVMMMMVIIMLIAREYEAGGRGSGRGNHAAQDGNRRLEYNVFIVEFKAV
jgi:hypothetical protein